MAKSPIFAGLDIGTSSIKMLVAAQKEEDGSFEIIFKSQEPSLGVRRGVVVDTDKVSRIIQILLEKTRTEVGRKINSVSANIGGSHLFCAFSRGTIAISRADQKVSEEDVKRVLQAAETLSFPPNKEIIQVFPREFIVDGEGGVPFKEVVGMQGVRLEAEVMVLGGFSPYKRNLAQAILDADIRQVELIPSVLASSSAVLTPRQKESGVALLDIGAGTTELAVFEEGDLVHLAIFPVGSSNITNDIAIGLKTDIDTAERIKKEYGSCLFKGKDKKEKIENDEETLVFSEKMLAKIIEARICQVFREAQKELKKIQKQGLLPAGIVLTGGGAKLPMILDLAKKEFKLPCKIGKPLGFSGQADDPAFATACGLILKAAETDKGMVSVGPGNFWQKIKSFFKSLIP